MIQADMIIECDVCGSTEGVQCEIMMKGSRVDRVYHLCPEHWVEVYRECIESFLDHNPYKVNSFIKNAADSLIIKQRHLDKLGDITTDDGVVDLNIFAPRTVRILRTFDVDAGDETNE
jgi:hypothetical protein